MTEIEFLEVFASPMQRVASDASPPFDFWDYFNAIPSRDFDGHDCSTGSVDCAWTDATGRFQHVLVNSTTPNAFMVVVLDLQKRAVHGHRLLNLNREYDLPSS